MLVRIPVQKYSLAGLPPKWVLGLLIQPWACSVVGKSKRSALYTPSVIETRASWSWVTLVGSPCFHLVNVSRLGSPIKRSALSVFPPIYRIY
ncbi:hypothetical protein GAGA_0465 [Paraglaciecola agarilytica NO2]|uniref:Secreted protein n=1 Tax=Paraglaciecola agarilytica NO2 TaxID=1125747 RepID=A0ABQ0I1W7_9ALTE|nr:hypothetical protein GAGA_0465 [Paraglaciecola agarilytica NO2]